MIRLLATPISAYNLARLKEDAIASLGAKDVNEIDDGTYLAVYLPDMSAVTAQDWQTLVNNHDPMALTLSQIETQLSADRTAVTTEEATALYFGLKALAAVNPANAVFVAVAREVAVKKLDPDPTTITTKNQAISYIRDTAESFAVTTETRDYVELVLGALVKVIAVGLDKAL
jgi:hypothetical protein